MILEDKISFLQRDYSDRATDIGMRWKGADVGSIVAHSRMPMASWFDRPYLDLWQASRWRGNRDIWVHLAALWERVESSYV